MFILYQDHHWSYRLVS